MSAPLNRAVLLGLSGIFVAVVLAYCAVWFHAAHWREPVDVGFSLEEGTVEIISLSPGGPAERAGLKPYDRLIAIDDDLVTREVELHDVLRRHRAGDRVQVTVLLAALNTPRTFDLVLGQPPARDAESWVRVAGRELVRAFPLALLALIVAVLLRRVNGVGAWLTALVATGMIGAVPVLPFFERIPPGLRGEVVAFKILSVGLGPAFLFYYLATFPDRSPVDERAPRLKSAWITAAAVVGGLFALRSWVTEAGGLHRGAWPTVGSWIAGICWVAAAGLGFVSLIEKARETRSAEAQSAIRVLEGGLAAALLSLLALPLAPWLSGRSLADSAGWALLPAALLLLALPLSLGYVATARPVLDLPVLLRRIVRGLLVERGAIAVILAIAATAGLVVADQAFRAVSQARWGSTFALLVGGIAGALLVRFGIPLHRRARTTIDRMLFPRTYRTRQILEALAERLPHAPSRVDLFRQLEDGLGDALGPSFLALYFRGDADCLRLEHGRAPADVETIPIDQPIDEDDAGGRNDAGSRRALTVGSLDGVRQVGSDYLVPIRGGESGLLGLLALGQRRDGEPYSREEGRLLLSLANRAARAIDAE